jgi:hypothetical protein
MTSLPTASFPPPSLLLPSSFPPVASEKLAMPVPSNPERDDMRRLSQLCTVLFRTFEDSVSPRMVPLFYDRNAGDVSLLPYLAVGSER